MFSFLDPLLLPLSGKTAGTWHHKRVFSKTLWIGNKISERGCYLASSQVDGEHKWIPFFCFLGSFHVFCCFTWIHFIYFSWTECYYIFNYKDHMDPRLFTCYDMLHTIILLISSRDYSPLRLKHTVGILLYTNMLSQYLHRAKGNLYHRNIKLKSLRDFKIFLCYSLFLCLQEINLERVRS